MKSEHQHRLPVLAAWCVGCVLVAPCVVGAAGQVAGRWGEVDWSVAVPSVRLFAGSVLWAVGIGVLAAVLAWPAAWLVARRGVRLWMMLPLLAPSYLAYHSLGLVRDPTTWLGGMIERSATSPPDGPGMYWLPVLVGRVLAFIGLGLWAWPLAAMVLGRALRSAETEMADALRLDGVGWIGRQWAYVRRTRGAVVRAAGLVALVMLGSSVPLHLANAPTLAIAAWQEVVLHPGTPGVWLLTWPLLVMAAAGAWVLSGAVLRAETGVDAREGARHARAALRTTLALVAASTLLPLMLYVLFLRRWASIPAFVRVSGEAAAWSTGVAVLVGAGAALVCGVFWWACATRGAGSSVQRAVRVALCGLVFAALAPGILVGHAWAAFWMVVGAPDAWMDTAAPTVLAHLTRFAGIAALAGCVLAGLEPAGTRDARAIDAGASLKAWVRTGLSWGTLAGVAVCVACLSLHEIESSIVVQPPGMLSLPQTMLGNLHFARQEETSAGAIVVIGAGMVVAAGAAAVGWLRGRRELVRSEAERR